MVLMGLVPLAVWILISLKRHPLMQGWYGGGPSIQITVPREMDSEEVGEWLGSKYNFMRSTVGSPLNHAMHDKRTDRFEYERDCRRTERRWNCKSRLEQLWRLQQSFAALRQQRSARYCWKWYQSEIHHRGRLAPAAMIDHAIFMSSTLFHFNDVDRQGSEGQSFRPMDESVQDFCQVSWILDLNPGVNLFNLLFC